MKYFYSLLILFIATTTHSQQWEESYWEEVECYRDGEIVDFYNHRILDAKCFGDECVMVTSYIFFFIEVFKSYDGGETWNSVYFNYFDVFKEPLPDGFRYNNIELAEIVSKNEALLTYDDKQGIIDRLDLNTFNIDTTKKLNTIHQIKNIHTNKNGYGIASHGITYFITKDNWKTEEEHKTHSIRDVYVTRENYYVNFNLNMKDTTMKINFSDDGLEWEQFTIGRGLIIDWYEIDNKLWAMGHEYYANDEKSDVFYLSEDSGKTWTKQYEDDYTSFGLYNLLFINKEFGIALSKTDIYYTTTDGGNSWTKQKRTKYDKFIEGNLAFANDKYLFQFVGEGGLFRYDLSLLNITSVPLDEYSLVGTYPNPFYNEFTISSTEITNDNYDVSIYDINANKVYSEYKYIDGDITINQGFVAGTYYLIIENDKRNYMQKIVKR